MNFDAMQRQMAAGRGFFQGGGQMPDGQGGGNYSFYNSNPYSQYDANSAYAAAGMRPGLGMMSTAHRDFGGNMGQAMGQMGQVLGDNANRQQSWDMAQMQNQTQQQKYGMLYNLFAPLMHSMAGRGGGAQHGGNGYVTSYGAMNVPGGGNGSNLMRLLAGSKLINNLGAGQNLSMGGNAQLRNWSGLA